MVLINYAGREINAKIVYYGPGLSGKTTNLECIYASVPANSRGKMVSMKTRQDRTLFFDFLPIELGEVHGFRTRFLLYTVPGQVFYNATRKLVLKGVDALVFVADSSRVKIEENRESLQNLEENLREQGLSLAHVPWVIQYNKRDVPDAMPVVELEAVLNPARVPSFEAAAASGQGVYETLHAVSRLLFQRLVHEIRPGGPRVAQATGEPPLATPPRPPAAARPVPPTPAWNVPAAPAAPSGGYRAAPIYAPGTGAGIATALPAVPASPAPAPRLAPALVTSQGAVQTAPQAYPQTAPTLGAPGPLAPEADQVEPATGATEEYGNYGHIVDLSLEMGRSAVGAQPTGGFIKDPLRRSDKPAPAVELGARGATPGETPLRTHNVPIVVTRAELKQGGVIRVVLDLRLEP